jgi:hypothetical protein
MASHPPGDAGPPRTATLPEAARGPWLQGLDLVTALREYNGTNEHALPSGQKKFSLGSGPDCDLAIPGPYVSSLHCILERRGHRLRVHDQDTRNGTFFAGRREPTFDLGAGEMFTAASTTLLAMNDEMRQRRPIIAALVGSDATPSPDDLLVAAVRGTNLLITGAPGCDQDRLARGIHAVSLRRSQPIVEAAELPVTRAAQRELIDRASRSTLVISLAPRPPRLDPAFCSMLLSSSFQIHLIVIAPTAAVATAALGSEAIGPMQHVCLRPLAFRAGELLDLLDRALAERGAALRTSELTPANQAALQAYAWPDNLVELRVAADRLDALVRERSLRRAADVLVMSKSTLHHWTDRLHLSWPLTQST